MEITVDLVMGYLIKGLISIAIFYIGKKVAKFLVSILEKMMQKSSFDETLSKFALSVIHVALLVFVALAALSNLGIETTSFVAIIGAAGLAVGLALKDTLSNIGAGVLIIIFKPFKLTDFVEAGGVAGVVEEINLFSTIFKTGDNKVIIVPNSSVIGGSITNYSKKETRRVDFTFGIGYDDDLKLAKQILEEVSNSDERVLKDPAAFVAVSALADSSVNFVVRVWVKKDDYWGVFFDITEKVKLTFDEKGITIPYPQMQVHAKVK